MIGLVIETTEDEVLADLPDELSDEALDRTAGAFCADRTRSGVEPG